jgi:ABC-type multidrug transport system fused ATPase/permease subunit
MSLHPLYAAARWIFILLVSAIPFIIAFAVLIETIRAIRNGIAKSGIFHPTAFFRVDDPVWYWLQIVTNVFVFFALVLVGLWLNPLIVDWFHHWLNVLLLHLAAINNSSRTMNNTRPILKPLQVTLGLLSLFTFTTGCAVQPGGSWFTKLKYKNDLRTVTA